MTDILNVENAVIDDTDTFRNVDVVKPVASVNDIKKGLLNYANRISLISAMNMNRKDRRALGKQNNVKIPGVDTKK